MKRSRRLASNRKSSKQRQDLPSWATWTESSFVPDQEIDEEDLWLRLQAFSIVSKEIQRALDQSLIETATDIVDEVAKLLNHSEDGRMTQNAPHDHNHTNDATNDKDDPTIIWKQFVIQEKEPRYTTALPILFIDAPLEQRDRILWMKHLHQLLKRFYTRKQVILFDNLEEYIQHRSSFDDENDEEYIYIMETVKSARMFGKCVQELATGSNACLIVLQPTPILLAAERWSADVYVKCCSLPTTQIVLTEFWKQMKDFPLAVDQVGDMGSSLSATMGHVLRSSANLLAHEGSFWAVAPILPQSLIRRAQSIHNCSSTVHMLPTLGCIPPEWNHLTRKHLLERLVRRYNALPHEVQLSARDSLHQSILWLHETTTRHHLVHLIFPQYDGDMAQPRRETVRALMETSVGEQWMEMDQRDATMDPYSKRHLAVCGLVRVLKNGVVEKKTHVWCAGD